MIDFHNHVLPKIDDGSKSLEMSINMLREAESQGITEVINTVHFQHPKMDGKDITFDIINEEIEKLQKALDREGINIKLHIGSEVFFLPNLLDIYKNPICTMGNQKFMLIEFYPFHMPPNFDEYCYQLKLLGTTPIIAHPERNRAIQNDIDIILRLMDAGCLIQLDAGSLLGHFGSIALQTAELMLERYMVHFLGSDAHNDRRRNFCLSAAFDIASKIMGENAHILVNDNPQKVIIGEDIIPFEIDESHRSSNFLTKLANKLKKLK